jgi:ABC-type polysaccharide/polyol phosphate transport system ATPase subunit
MSAAIEIRGVGKRYQKLEQQAMLLRAILPFSRKTRHEFWALRDIDLEVGDGETLGVVGQNGAGKTTLLRLLAGVTRPTVGDIRVSGRIGPLISLGVGFHDEMTGRENVLVNGMLLGLTAKEVERRLDEIVAFAELEGFIDTAVKFYSSGMFMRLGFAVIAHIEPTVLLMDEVLAVGDGRFQLKCFDRLRSLQNQGAAVVMVSHSMHIIRQVCQRAVLLRQGRIEYDGDVEGAIALHERRLVGSSLQTSAGAVEIIDREFVGAGTNNQQVSYDEPVVVKLRLCFHRPVNDPVVTVGVITTTGLFAGFDSTLVGHTWRMFQTGEEAIVDITFPARLGGGSYRLVVDVKDQKGAQRLARSDDLILNVASRAGSAGMSDVCAEIELEDPVTHKLEQS